MALQLVLVRDNKVLFRFPIRNGAPAAAAPSDVEVDRLSNLCSIGANRKRLKVMLEFARGKEMRFSEILMLATNPKLAQDCLQPLMNEGLVLHGGRGSTYKASARGVALGLTMSVGLGQLFGVLQKELEGES